MTRVPVVVQSGLAPYTMRCLTCDTTWVPASTSDRGLDRSAFDHHCPPEAPGKDTP